LSIASAASIAFSIPLFLFAFQNTSSRVKAEALAFSSPLLDFLWQDYRFVSLFFNV